MDFLTMSDINLRDKRVLIRSDLNTPISHGNITNESRILASLPTYKQALDAGSKVIVMSHLGRPKEGESDEAFSLAPIAQCLSKHLNTPVKLIKNWLSDEFSVDNGEIVLLENVRFCKGEKANDMELAKKMAALCDVYVMDAFGAAHRAHASTEGIGHYASTVCAGPLLVSEIHALNRALHSPKHPILAIVGGSKISSKLPILESFAQQCDDLIVGGGIANTFLAAKGFAVGKSLIEPDMLTTAHQLIEKINIPLPMDVVVANEFSEHAPATKKSVDLVQENEMILDVGPKTCRSFDHIIAKAKTIIWNGPIGVFEWDAFGQGTESIAHAIASSHAFSIAGGGDTLAAIDKYNISHEISYISTGGGAFLEYMEGKKLPAIQMLMSSAK